MRRLSLVLAAGILVCFYATVNADIYVWTDESGIKHLTNTVPPAEAVILMQTVEIPYNEKADKERMKAEQLERMAAAWQEIADMKAELIKMQQDAEWRIKEANQKAQDAVEYAESLITAAQEDYNGYCSRGYRYHGNYPCYNNFKHSSYNRWYYRKNGNIYYKSAHHKHRKDHYKKHHLKKHRYKYYGKKRHIPHHTRTKIRGLYNGHRSRFSGYRSRGYSSRYGRHN